ncbi:MAG: hypothetical protein EXR69_06830 [Myxococcales bacterium]|nr:hypothetical protein [Myxococcales bacterium]
MRVPGAPLLAFRRSLTVRTVAALAVLMLFVQPAMANSTPPSSTAVPTGSATVPLYGGVQATDPFFYVEATVGDRSVLLRLDTANAAVHLSDAAAARRGPRWSKARTRPNASTPALTIGTMTIERVAVCMETPLPSRPGRRPRAAIAPAAAIQKADYGDVLEARLKAELTAHPALVAWSGAPWDLSAYADFRKARARGTEAIPMRKQMAEALLGCDERLRCEQVLLAVGRQGEAAAVLIHAHDLYTAWADQPLSLRQRVHLGWMRGP